MGYLIIGASAAGTAALEEIRKIDKKGDITIISGEPYRPYCRALISYLLAGKISPERMYYRSEDFYKNHKVREVRGKQVISLDTQKKRVFLEDGNEISFEKLLIATGGRPIVPDLKGKDRKRVFTFTTWDNTKEILKAAKKGMKAIIIGGGMIGLKAAEALAYLELKVTIIELADRILAPSLDPNASKMLYDHLSAKGIDIYLNNTVETILGKNENGEVEGVILKDGRDLKADMVIFAIGVIPNIEIAKNTPIKTNRGILVNDHMETSVLSIYAAGDVAEAYHILYETSRPTPIWPNACLQGRIAGSNMAGIEKIYPGGIDMNSIDLFGFSVISVGIANPPQEDGYLVETRTNNDKGTYKKMVFKDDHLVGAIFLGDISRAGIITGLIKDQVNIAPFKKDLLEDNFGYISFPRELRKEKIN